jgi:hypothetical protein
MSWPHRLFAGQFTDFELKLLRVFETRRGTALEAATPFHRCDAEAARPSSG